MLMFKCDVKGCDTTASAETPGSHFRVPARAPRGWRVLEYEESLTQDQLIEFIKTEAERRKVPAPTPLLPLLSPLRGMRGMHFTRRVHVCDKHEMPIVEPLPFSDYPHGYQLYDQEQDEIVENMASDVAMSGLEDVRIA